MDPAGHQVVASAFGRAGREHRRFNFHEAPGIQKFPDAPENAVPRHQVVAHGGAADVQIPVLKAQVLGHVVGAGGRSARHHCLVGNGEGQGVRFGKHRELRHEHFDWSRFDVGVFRPREAFSNVARNRNTVFGTQQGRLTADVARGGVRAEDDLYNAAAVAQVDKQKAAVIAESVHPAGQEYPAADVFRRKFAAKNALRKLHINHPFRLNRESTNSAVS